MQNFEKGVQIAVCDVEGERRGGGGCDAGRIMGNTFHPLTKSLHCG